MRSIPPELLAKIKGQNQTIWNGANPKMSIVVARAKSSVRDSTYFTIEKIREKEGITDIAVSARRMKPIGPPDRIYGIHIDNGMAKTSMREYPDKLKEHWKPQFDVDPAKGVSIVFDGRWHMNYKKTWGLVTDELPWIFWIDSSNNLKARIWNTGDIYTLSTNVSKVDTVRGWIPVQAGHTDDQGIIVAYVKSDGKIYYRNYCMQSTGIFIWETEKEMTDFGSGCTGVRLFRTNDFRVGFIAEKSTGNLLAITARNWAGMSIAPESLFARLNADIEFIPIEKSISYNNENISANVEIDEFELCGIDVEEPEVVDSKRSGNNKVILEFNQEVINYNNCANAFTLSTGETIYTINNIDIGNTNKKLVITIDEAVDVTLSIDIAYDSSKGKLRTYVNDYCRRLVGSFNSTAAGAPQDGYSNEYLNASVAGTIGFAKLTKSSGYAGEEYLQSSISATIQFWIVENAPV